MVAETPPSTFLLLSRFCISEELIFIVESFLYLSIFENFFVQEDNFFWSFEIILTVKWYPVIRRIVPECACSRVIQSFTCFHCYFRSIICCCHNDSSKNHDCHHHNCAAPSIYHSQCQPPAKELHRPKFIARSRSDHGLAFSVCLLLTKVVKTWMMWPWRWKMPFKFILAVLMLMFLFMLMLVFKC